MTPEWDVFSRLDMLGLVGGRHALTWIRSEVFSLRRTLGKRQKLRSVTLQWLERAQGFSVCTYDIPSTLPNAFSWGQAVCSISNICVLASGSIRSLTHPILGCVSVCSVVYMHMGMHVCSSIHMCRAQRRTGPLCHFQDP